MSVKSHLKSVQLDNRSHVDQPQQDTSMDPVTPRELDATIKALDAAWDARSVKAEAALNIRLSSIDSQIANATELLTESATSSKDLRGTIITTAIVTVVAVVLGLGALNYALIQSMLAAFESGRAVAREISEAKERVSTSITADPREAPKK